MLNGLRTVRILPPPATVVTFAVVTSPAVTTVPVPERPVEVVLPLVVATVLPAIARPAEPAANAPGVRPLALALAEFALLNRPLLTKTAPALELTLVAPTVASETTTASETVAPATIAPDTAPPPPSPAPLITTGVAAELIDELTVTCGLATADGDWNCPVTMAGAPPCVLGPGNEGPRYRSRGRIAATVASASSDEETMPCGGIPVVPDDDPGVAAGAGAAAGPPLDGSPAPGVRLVVQPNAAMDIASVRARKPWNPLRLRLEFSVESWRM